MNYRCILIAAVFAVFLSANRFSAAEKSEKTENKSKEEQLKDVLINRLEGSMNFTNTHSVISQLVKIKSWSNVQKEKLLKIALKNYQVTYILKDEDVRRFYEPP